jgi:ethanolamine utilization protein EutQ
MSGPGVLKVSSDDPGLRWYRRGDQQLRLADAVDGSDGAAMTVGFARYAAGESNEWVMSYDEALVVTRGAFAVDSNG